MTVGSQNRLERRGAVHRLLKDRDPNVLVVAGLGSAIWDAESAGETPLNFYLLGAMGSATPTALGLATAQPDKRVIALVGDAELAMGLYALATIGWRKPENLSVICLDNGRFGETGGQVSHTGMNLDLAGVAAASGIQTVRRVNDDAGIDELRELVMGGPGPVFGLVEITADMPPVAMPIRNGVIGMTRFREALLGPQALKE
ncbi:MAG: thiamine pyrophosphate-dependent enzyme [Alphaproteobacteria bacterium]|jgi:thiamine pyrophosphate-dependent acetolactate synthase large subunit-like protein